MEAELVGVYVDAGDVKMVALYGGQPVHELVRVLRALFPKLDGEYIVGLERGEEKMTLEECLGNIKAVAGETMRLLTVNDDAIGVTEEDVGSIVQQIMSAVEMDSCPVFTQEETEILKAIVDVGDGEIVRDLRRLSVEGDLDSFLALLLHKIHDFRHMRAEHHIGMSLESFKYLQMRKCNAILKYLVEEGMLMAQECNTLGLMMDDSHGDVFLAFHLYFQDGSIDELVDSLKHLVSSLSSKSSDALQDHLATSPFFQTLVRLEEKNEMDSASAFFIFKLAEAKNKDVLHVFDTMDTLKDDKVIAQQLLECLRISGLLSDDDSSGDDDIEQLELELPLQPYAADSYFAEAMRQVEASGELEKDGVVLLHRMLMEEDAVVTAAIALHHESGDMRELLDTLLSVLDLHCISGSVEVQVERLVQSAFRSGISEGQHDFLQKLQQQSNSVLIAAALLYYENEDWFEFIDTLKSLLKHHNEPKSDDSDEGGYDTVSSTSSEYTPEEPPVREERISLLDTLDMEEVLQQ